MYEYEDEEHVFVFVVEAKSNILNVFFICYTWNLLFFDYDYFETICNVMFKLVPVSLALEMLYFFKCMKITIY